MRAGIVAAAAAGAVMSLLDVAVTFAQMRSAAQGWGERLTIVLHVAAAWSLGALAVGAGAGTILAAIRRIDALDRAVHGIPGWIRSSWKPSPSGFAATLAASLVAPAGFGLAWAIVLTWIERLHRPSLMALAIVLSLAAVGLIAALAALVVFAAGRWLGARLGRFGAPLLVLIPAAGAATTGLVVFVIRAPEILPGVSLVPSALGLGFLGLLGAAWAVPVLRRAGLRAVAGLATATVVLSVVSALSFGRSQNAAFLVYSYSPIGGSLVRSYTRLVDFDGDGYSPLWGGGDCNDLNRRIHPGAVDAPGNGVDENCFGGDASGSASGLAALRPTDARSLPRMNVVVITIDALRSDRVGAYGYRRHPTTPFIDRFAASAVRFRRAYSQSSRSLRSLASMMTGLYPSQIRWQTEFIFPSPRAEMHMLAERLQEAGYQTASFTATDYFAYARGMYQGFELVDYPFGFKVEGEQTLGRLVAYLRTRTAAGPPYFVWTHYMGTHEPYGPRPGFAAFGNSFSDLFDQEIAHADVQVRRIVGAIESSEVAGRTVVIVTADHGDEHGEHGRYFHGQAVYRESIQVPLVVRLPGASPRVAEGLAGLLDLTPTILELAKIHPTDRFAGRSLLPVLLGQTDAVRDHLFAETMPDSERPDDVKSVIEGDLQLIYDVRGGVFQLYDLRADPLQRVNLVDRIGRIGPVATRLRTRLLDWMSASLAEENRIDDAVQAAILPSAPVAEHPSGVRFGDAVELIGYDDPDQVEARAGSFVRYTFYFRCLRRIERDLRVVVRFESTTRTPVPGMLNGTHTPVRGRYPTSQWHAGEIIRDRIEIPINDDAPADELRAFLSFGEGAQRLTPDRGANGRAEIELRRLRVTR